MSYGLSSLEEWRWKFVSPWGSFLHGLLICLGVKENLKLFCFFYFVLSTPRRQYLKIQSGGVGLLHSDTHLFGPDPNESKSLLDCRDLGHRSDLLFIPFHFIFFPVSSYYFIPTLVYFM